MIVVPPFIHVMSDLHEYEPKERDKKEENRKNDAFRSFFYIVIILFPLFLFIFTDNGKESLVFDRRKTILTSIGKDEVVLTRTMKAAEAVMLPFIRFLKSLYSINRFSRRVCEVIYIHT